jgi:small subunit ribosomal protein S9
MPKVVKKTKKTAEAAKQAKIKKEKYFGSVGRRKTAVARVRLFPQKGRAFSVNEKTLDGYFPTRELQQSVIAPLDLTGYLEQFKVSVRVKGGGTVSQAEAIRHGIARALVLFDPELRKKLKKAGFLKRDPRMRERKKFGLKRARKAPQWQKR